MSGELHEHFDTPLPPKWPAAILGPGPLERRILAVAAVVLLDLVLLGAAAAAQAMVKSSPPSEATTSQRPAAASQRPTVVKRQPWRIAANLPREPLLITVVALLMAHSSLAAIWWARTGWPSHAKSLVTLLVCAGLWALLVGMLDTVRREPIAAAAWAASLGTQVLLTGLLAALLELALDYRPAVASFRFSILFLLIWTTLVAVLLGAGRWLIERQGWTVAAMLDWQFVWHLQGVGLANAILAVSLLTFVRLAISWRARCAACALTVCTVALVTPLSMQEIFGSRSGPTLADMVWLWSGEGLFLVATLIPLEMARACPPKEVLSCDRGFALRT